DARQRLARRFRTIQCWRKREQAPALQTLARNPSASGGFDIPDRRLAGRARFWSAALLLFHLHALPNALLLFSTEYELSKLVRAAPGRIFFCNPYVGPLKVVLSLTCR